MFLLSIILRACVRCVFGCISVPHPHICCHTGDAARVGKPAADLFSSTVWHARSSTSYEYPQRSDNFVLNLDWAHHNYGEFDESRHFTPHPAILRHSSSTCCFSPFFDTNICWTEHAISRHFENCPAILCLVAGLVQFCGFAAKL